MTLLEMREIWGVDKYVLPNKPWFDTAEVAIVLGVDNHKVNSLRAGGFLIPLRLQEKPFKFSRQSLITYLNGDISWGRVKKHWQRHKHGLNMAAKLSKQK